MIGAVLIEVLLIAVTIPFTIANDMDTVIAIAVPGCFVRLLRRMEPSTQAMTELGSGLF